MEKDSKIFIAGHNGLVGSAIDRYLLSNHYRNIIRANKSELDLTDSTAVDRFFSYHRPEYVFLAAAKVGGIHANKTYPADFIYSNLQIQNNVIHNCWNWRVTKLLFLGSSCIYPKFAEQPIRESALLTGELEPTNDAYAIAKIAGIKMCQSYNRQYYTNFISVMPTNLFGPRDQYHPQNSHVIPALIRRIHEAKVNNSNEVVIWGTGTPLREFLYVDDLADACVFLMENYNDSEIINIGSGFEFSIKETAETIAAVIGYEGKIVFDSSKPDGTPRKRLDISKLATLGWLPRTFFSPALQHTYEDFLEGLK